MNTTQIENYLWSVHDDFFGSVDSHVHCDACDYLGKTPGEYRGNDNYVCRKREDGELCPIVAARLEVMIEGMK